MKLEPGVSPSKGILVLTKWELDNFLAYLNFVGKHLTHMDEYFLGPKNCYIFIYSKKGYNIILDYLKLIKINDNNIRY